MLRFLRMIWNVRMQLRAKVNSRLARHPCRARNRWIATTDQRSVRGQNADGDLRYGFRVVQPRGRSGAKGCVLSIAMDWPGRNRLITQASFEVTACVPI